MSPAWKPGLPHRTPMSQKVYEVAPLECTQRGTPTHIVSFIEAPKIMETILVHLQLREGQQRPPLLLYPTTSRRSTMTGVFDGLVKLALR
jgi:hypothetical protein